MKTKKTQPSEGAPLDERVVKLFGVARSNGKYVPIECRITDGVPELREAGQPVIYPQAAYHYAMTALEEHAREHCGAPVERVEL